MKGWRYSEADCDVHDRAKLIRYRELIPAWLELLNGEDQHAISTQLSDMLWQDAAWRSMNHVRQWRDAGACAAVAPLLAGFLDRGYVSGQIVSIGKLLERSDPRRPERGVVSLRRIVDELMANKDLFTREVFVSHDGLPYDWEAARHVAVEQMISAGGGVHAGWASTHGHDAWYSAIMQHDRFDALSGKKPCERSRDDRIDDAVLERLSSALLDPVFQDILRLRNKSLAHAADAFSREQAGQLRSGLKLDEFARAHRLLLGVTQAISAGILYDEWRGSAVPTAQFNQFEGLSGCVVPEPRMRQLVEFWDQHCSERDEWLTSAFWEFIPRQAS